MSAATVSIALALLAVTASASAAPHPGRLDKSFGEGGRALVSVRVRIWAASPVAATGLPGGRIVVGGEHTVVVLRNDGRIDRRFGKHGHVNLPVVNKGKTFIKDAAVDPRGRIVVLAAARFGGGGLAMVARLTARGRYDKSFARDGILLTSFGQPAAASPPCYGPPGYGNCLEGPTDVLPQNLAIDDRGRPVIAGTTTTFVGEGVYQGPSYAGYLARLLPSGRLDPSFGKSGVVPTQSSPYGPRTNGLAIEGRSIFYASEAGLLESLNGAGKLDATFGTNGIVEITPRPTRPLDITIDRQGRVLVLREGDRRAFYGLNRWNPDGTPDMGFGHDGKIAVEVPGPNEEIFLQALAVDARGRPLLAGRIAFSEGRSLGNPSFLLMRLRTSGRLDRAFGKHGRVVTTFGPRSQSQATDIVVQGKKAIVVGPVFDRHSRPSEGFAVARYRAGR